jgi:hypothetical protein
MFDDHYVANPSNAHLDTSELETELNTLFGTLSGQDLENAALWPSIHDLIEKKASTAPNEPSDDQLICRYLSPIKFLWLLSQRAVFFGRADGFDDARDSVIPEDYSRCVQRLLMERNVIPIAWDEHVRLMQSRWLVSCWTEITDHHDDNLLWHRYADGKYGVGITLRYGMLRDIFKNALEADRDTEGFYAGYVSYDHPLKIAPFNKRRIFRNEKEIRFVSRTDILAHKHIEISDLISEIELRISPEASGEHRDAIRDAWLRLGGEDRIQIAG